VLRPDPASGRSGLPGLLLVHAHPDDEAFATGGLIARAAAQGHRVDLVTCTGGEEGEIHDPTLDYDEAFPRLRAIREAELRCSLAALRGPYPGELQLHLLGYHDSGMMGTPENDLPGSFWSADVDEAVARLVAVLEEERADVLTCYDEIGGYGHPDHIQVHRVGLRAGDLVGVPKVFQSTINRDAIIRDMEAGRAQMLEAGIEMPDFEASETFGMPEAVITCAVDVREFVGLKREAMRAHASQIGETHFMLQMPDDAFERAFGTEWFIRSGQGPGITERDII
jgi:LmbE family N-acetylglucosaminyl deacetylase